MNGDIDEFLKKVGKDERFYIEVFLMGDGVIRYRVYIGNMFGRYGSGRRYKVVEIYSGIRKDIIWSGIKYDGEHGYENRLYKKYSVTSEYRGGKWLYYYKDDESDYDKVYGYLELYRKMEDVYMKMVRSSNEFMQKIVEMRIREIGLEEIKE